MYQEEWVRLQEYDYKTTMCNSLSILTTVDPVCLWLVVFSPTSWVKLHLEVCNRRIDFIQIKETT